MQEYTLIFNINYIIDYILLTILANFANFLGFMRN